MSDGKVYEVLEALRARIQAGIPGIKRVEVFEGIFDDEAMKQMLGSVLTNPDVIRIAFLGATNIEERAGGEAILYASFGVFTITTGANKARLGLNRMEAVIATVMGIGQGDSEPLTATHVLDIMPGEIQNLYSKEVGARGVAIYAASFVAPIVIGKAVFGGDTEKYDPTTWVVSDLLGEDVQLELDIEGQL